MGVLTTQVGKCLGEAVEAMLKSLSRDAHLFSVIFLTGTWTSAAFLMIAYTNAAYIRWELGRSLLTSGVPAKSSFVGILTSAFCVLTAFGVLLLLASPPLRKHRVIWLSLCVSFAGGLICLAG